MDLSVVAFALEGLAAVAVLMLASKRPKYLIGLAGLAAIIMGYTQSGAVPVAGTSAADGRTTMKAAIFAPGAPHDVRVRGDIPIAATHKGYELFVKVTAAGLNPSNFKINFAKIPFVRHFSQYHVVVSA